MSEQYQFSFLPQGWVEVKLGEVLPIEYGKGLPEKDRNSSGKVPVYGSNGLIGWHSEALTKSATLIIGRKGGAGQVHYSPVPCWTIDTAYYVEAAISEFIDLRYFLHLLKSVGLEQFDKSTAIPSLSRDDYNQIKVPLVSLAEQKRIANEIEKQFSRIDAAIENLQRVERNLERLRTVTLKVAMEGQLVPNEAALAFAEGRDYEAADVLLQKILHERCAKWEAEQLAKMKEKGKAPKDDSWKGRYPEPNPPETINVTQLPEGWIWATIDQLSFVVRGASPRPAGDSRFFGGNIPWITVGALTADKRVYLDSVSEFLTEAGREDSRYIEPKTLLLTNSGATLGVPKITLIGGCINDGVAAILNIDYPIKLYLYYFLETQTTRLRAIKQGAAQPNLNTNIIRSILVPLPPLNEQKRINTEIERRISVIEELKKLATTALRRAVILRQKILREAFGGKLIPQDPSDEPAIQLFHKIKAERAQRETERNAAKKGIQTTMKPKSKLRAAKRRELTDVLKEVNDWMKPEELFSGAGYKPEEIEEFYADLKLADIAGAVDENKQPNGSVHLKART
jgi:type I restriction enzyme, S subunit